MNGKNAKQTRRQVERERQAIVGATLDKMLDYPLKYRLQIAWNIARGRKKAKKVKAAWSDTPPNKSVMKTTKMVLENGNTLNVVAFEQAKGRAKA